MKIFKAHFTSNGSEIILTGRRKYFYVYSLSTGNIEKVNGIRGRDEKSLENSYISPCNKYLVILGISGYIILISMITKQWIGNLKINGHANAVSFTGDHKYLYALGTSGEVYKFDLETRECVHRFEDHGTIKATTIDISLDNRWIAIGSSLGIVNLYSMEKVTASNKPTPEKAIMNLISPITNLKFHPSSELLIFSSRQIKDSLRIFHISTMKIVKNWPTDATPLGYVSDFDLSNDGRHIAVGNAKGRVLLYRFGAF